ncbi:MAG: hypothetical protein RJA22_281 [Verrucomicrobiota bacterium]
MGASLATLGGAALAQRGLAAPGGPVEDLPPPTPIPYTPFTADLPRPPIAQPLAVSKRGAPFKPGDCFHGIAPEFSRLAEWQVYPLKYYSLEMRESVHEFIPGVPTPVWAYNGIVPGPTFKARMGEPAVVRFTNRLPVENSVHLHGGHTPAHADGHPYFYVLPGKARDYFYPNTVPLLNGARDYSESISTGWYHDHAMDITAYTAYLGLSGFYLVTDALEAGLIGNQILPADAYDVPLALCDKRFNADGTLYYDFLNHDGAIGDVFLANGKVQPRMVVERRKYRFRILNAGNARFLNLRLSNGQPFLQIGNDSWLLPYAMPRPEILMGMGNRVDVIIDFTNAPNELYLTNNLEQIDGRKPTGLFLANPIPLVKFIVQGTKPRSDAKVTANTVLRPHVAIRPEEIVASRTFDLGRTNGSWVINDQLFDPLRADAVPRLGSAERWTITNGSGGWWHPLHVHLESHQVLSINGQAPPPWLSFKSDTTVLPDSTTVQFVMKFRTFTGPFVFHCHNLEHEDLRMMMNVDPRVTPVPAPTPVLNIYS